MRSPFPGMDPYLEARWGDVHVSLCAGIRAALQARLPHGLRARAEQRVVLEGEDEKGLLRQHYATDIAVVENTPGRSHPVSGSGTTAVAEALILRVLPVDPRERWVEIIDTSSGNKVITVIEILSPGNKAPGKLNRKYRRKLRQYVNAGVNVVEIDLLRSRRERLQIKSDDLPPEKRTPYITCICRPDDDPDVWLVYPIALRSPLPTIPIPCRLNDPDVLLSLQPLIDQIYIDGGHDDIDYNKPLREPLSTDDAKWAAELVALAR